MKLINNGFPKGGVTLWQGYGDRVPDAFTYNKKYAIIRNLEPKIQEIE